MPVLSNRRNIVVIADEAHRNQYDIERAVQDGATVPIYYESRRICVDLYMAIKRRY